MTYFYPVFATQVLFHKITRKQSEKILKTIKSCFTILSCSEKVIAWLKKIFPALIQI